MWLYPEVCYKNSYNNMSLNTIIILQVTLETYNLKLTTAVSKLHALRCDFETSCSQTIDHWALSLINSISKHLRLFQEKSSFISQKMTRIRVFCKYSEI